MEIINTVGTFLSNFHPSEITIDGLTYLTVEHFYQSQKTLVPHEWKAIVSQATPKEARKLGRKCTMRPDWEDVRDHVMLQALRVKFSIPEFKTMLNNTGDSLIEEQAPWDSYWGTGPDGKGLNKLGKMLMQIRSENRMDG